MNDVRRNPDIKSYIDTYMEVEKILFPGKIHSGHEMDYINQV